MANNWMILKNTRTGRSVHLAKYYPSTGWYINRDSVDSLNDDLHNAEFSAEETDAMYCRGHSGFGPPYSKGGMWGDEWVLEYDVTSDA